MNTRSQTNKMNIVIKKEKEKQFTFYKVEINFDEASEAWKSNKKCIGNGHYK